MGLDITAYSNLRYLGHCPDVGFIDHGYDPKTDEYRHVKAYAYDAFPHALVGIPDIRPEDGYGNAKFLDGGCFEVTNQTETHRFRAGSYGGYARWRNDLAFQFNPYRDGGRGAPSAEGPFYELLWFADNEGTLGEIAATSLLGNFRQFEMEYRARHHSTEDGKWYVQQYTNWMRACELAADGGLIDFH